MTTIIQGNKDLLKEYKYFQCPRCGWIGKAEKTEYKYCGNQIDGDAWKVSCLCCDNTAYDITDKHTLEKAIAEEIKINSGNYWENR